MASSGNVLLKDKNNPKFNGLKAIIEDTFREGYISFDYAYILAKHYLRLIPELVNILQNRFSCVFVDEMQDMEPHQYEILEEVSNT